jgi:hypothetical protein
MPIRMTDDPVDPNQRDDDGGGGGGRGPDLPGGGGGLMSLLPMLIRSARFNNTSDGTIYFKVDANDNKAVACVVAIDKQ